MLFRRKKKPKATGLPSQEVLRETCLRPGRKVDLIIDTDLERDLIDIRTTTLHDVEQDGRLVLAQPFPAIGRSRVGSMLEATFLARFYDVPDGRWLRVGYKTKLAEIAEDYSIGRGIQDSVVILPGPKEFSQFTLRLNYRLAPPKDRDLRLYIWPDRTKVELMDISAGGVKFSHPEIYRFSVGTQLTLLLAGQGKELLLEGISVRSGNLKIRGFTSVQFNRLRPDIQRDLSKLLQDMMRQKLAQRSGVSDKGF